jgi:hypothetical protein
MRTTDITNTLKIARDIIDGGWTQGVFARNAEGTDESTNWLSGINCTCYCLAGAIDRAAVIVSCESYPGSGAIATKATAIVNRVLREQRLFWGSEITWNDQPGRHVDEVLDLLDDAISLSEKESCNQPT